jgi:glutamate-1-semialdehyde 2,1-aminomutase
MNYTLNHVGSLGSLFFTNHEVKNYNLAKTSDTKQFADYFRFMIHHGIYLAPSQFEAMFVSASIKEKEVTETLRVIDEYFSKQV